jgi:hypothetical protein
MCLAFADLPPGFNQPAAADQAAIGSEICAKRTDRAKPRGRRGKAWSGYAVEVTSQKMLCRNSLSLAPHAITDRFLQLLLLAPLSPAGKDAVQASPDQRAWRKNGDQSDCSRWLTFLRLRPVSKLLSFCREHCSAGAMNAVFARLERRSGIPRRTAEKWRLDVTCPPLHTGMDEPTHNQRAGSSF